MRQAFLNAPLSMREKGHLKSDCALRSQISDVPFSTKNLRLQLVHSVKSADSDQAL